VVLGVLLLLPQPCSPTSCARSATAPKYGTIRLVIDALALFSSYAYPRFQTAHRAGT
jgi:hypothetical protein